MTDTPSPDLNSPRPFRLTAQQERIATLLLKRLGPTYSSVFTDICRLIDQGEGYKSQRYLIGHLISELEGAIRGLLLSIASSEEQTPEEVESVFTDKKRELIDQGEGYKTQKYLVGHLISKLKRAIRGLLLSADSSEEQTPEEVESVFTDKKRKLIECLNEIGYKNPNGCDKVKRVLDNLKNPDNHSKQIKRILSEFKIDDHKNVSFWLAISQGLHNHRHLPRKNGLKKVDDDFKNLWENFQSLLETVLDKIERRYTDFLKIVDEIKNKPSINNLKRFHALPNNPIIQQEFFNDNDSVEWFNILKNAKYFESSLPSQERLDDEKIISQNKWAAGDFLNRICLSGDDNIHKSILDIIKKLPNTGNVFVNGDTIKIIASLPITYSVQLESKVHESLRSLNTSFFLDETTKLVVAWIKEGCTKEGLRLLQSILTSSTDGDENAYEIEDWAIKKLLQKIVPVLPRTELNDALTFFCELLSEALRKEYTNGKDDDFYYRRTDIAEEGLSTKNNINLLISAIRDICISAVSTDVAAYKTIMSVLDRYEGKTFTRLEMHLLSLFPEQDIEKTKTFLTEEKYANDDRVRFEYRRLALSGFSLLDKAAQDKIIKRINNGPHDIEDFKRRVLKNEEQEPTENDIQRYKDVHFRDAVKGWESVLPVPMQERYKAIVSALGPTVEAGVVYSTGTLSPFSDDQIDAWTVNEIINEIQNWVPSDSIMAPSTSGLRLALKTAVKKNPDKFLSEVNLLFQLEPTYIQGILNSLNELIRNNTAIDWDKALVLCEWVVAQQDRCSEDKKDGGDGDASWKWCLLDALHLITSGLHSTTEAEIPIILRQRAFQLLDSLADFDDGETSPSPDEDVYNRIITRVSAQALEGAIQYGLWVLRHKEKKGQTVSSFSDDLTELETLLDRSLNTCPAAHKAVFGRFFPWLFLMDKGWAAKNHHQIFLKPLRTDPAWSTYIVYTSGPYKDVVELIMPLYRAAVEETKTASAVKDEDYSQKLGDSCLIISMWSNDSGLMESFFNSETDKSRAHVVWFISRVLKENELDEKAVSLVKGFLESRMKAISSDSNKEKYAKELQRYGSLTDKELLPQLWRLDFLGDLLENAIKIDEVSKNCDLLLKAFKDHSQRVINYLERLLFEPEINRWEISHCSDTISKIIELGLSHEDEAVQDKANEIKNRLVAEGFVSFKNLGEPKENN